MTIDWGALHEGYCSDCTRSYATGEGIYQLLFDLNRQLGIAAIVVTHNPRLAERMPRRLRLHEGLVMEA